MKAKNWNFTPANANLTGFASNMTGAGPWTMTTTTSGDSLAHQASCRNDTATDHSAKSLTFTGTDPDGRTQTETINAPGVSATVETAKYWKTLTTVTISATINADTFDFGWVDEFASNTIVLNWRKSLPASIEVDLTGTINFDIETTFRNPWASTNTDSESLGWLNDANWTAKSADLLDDLALAGTRAMRFVCNSYTDGVIVNLYATFPGYST
jgi:hypothetical protein